MPDSAAKLSLLTLYRWRERERERERESGERREIGVSQSSARLGQREQHLEVGIVSLQG